MSPKQGRPFTDLLEASSLEGGALASHTRSLPLACGLCVHVFWGVGRSGPFLSFLRILKPLKSFARVLKLIVLKFRLDSSFAHLRFPFPAC